MADLTELTNDEFASSFRDHFAEAHRRLDPTGYIRLKEWLAVSHKYADRIGKVLAQDGEVSLLSVGGDKPEGPPPNPPGTP